MLVRSFQLSDYKQVTALFENVLSEICCEETMGAFARQLSWDSDLILVAVNQGEIIGAIIGTIDNNKGYFYRIAVAQEHRNKGVGKSLIHALRKKFLQRKVSKIYVTVDTHNEPILPIYESVGYEKVDFSHTTNRLKIVGG